MYISIKALRIIAAIIIISIIYINVSLSHNEKVSDKTNRKVGNISVIVIILLVVLGVIAGIFQ